MFRLINEQERAEVYLYGRIGEDFWGDGNSAKGFCDQLKQMGGKPLDVHIDSGGGDVFEAYAICAAIERYPGDTTAYIDGLAASAASYIAVVCDEVKMNEYAWIMIHQAAAYTMGNADELEKLVERLREIDRTIATIYERRTLLTMDEVLEAMKLETWYSAPDALEANFCQEIIQTEERMAACDELSASEYLHKPADVLVESPSNTVANMESEQPSYFAVDGRVYRKERE